VRKIATMVLTAGVLAGLARAADFDYFHRTYADAEKIARKEGKPLYLHFTTVWCGWCRRIENDIYKLPEGKKALSPFVCATLDCTVPRGQRPTGTAAFNQNLMRKYGGGGYPFLVIVTPDGDVLHKILGYKPMAAFKEEVGKAAENYQKLKAFQAYAAKADKSGYEYNAKALEFYSATGSWRKAAEAAAAVKKLDPQFKKGRAALASFALLQAAGPESEEKTAALEDDVVRHDPRNAEGYLEKVLWARASRIYRSAAQSGDETVKKARTQQAVDALSLLLKKAEKLSDRADVYGFMGWLSMKAGKNDEAIAAMEKSIELAPKSRRAAMLKQLIEQMKKAKAGK
jgi:tetratricopeptide (TPR) repeat protein